MDLRTVIALCFLCVLAVACNRNTGDSNSEEAVRLQLPSLSDDDFRSIASRIFFNETGGQARYLTYWDAGEDFPSFGIGHFIWFPVGVDAPFDESFPAMLNFVASRGGDVPPSPDWIDHLASMDAPWSDKSTFDAAQSSSESIELRDWLASTRSSQARFIAHSFNERWRKLVLDEAEKNALTTVLNELMQTPDGLFAVLDYVNFKGLGNNPRERYEGSGWGLLQVLGDAAQLGCAESAVISNLDCFSFAAAKRLRERVILSPPTRNEERWLEGWSQRVADYIPARDGFAITPYLQNPTKTSMAVIWFSRSDASGTLTVWTEKDGNLRDAKRIVSVPVAAPSLYYHTAEFESFGSDKPRADTYQHELEISGLSPGNYQYAVQQGVEEAGGQFRLLSESQTPLRFIVYGDSETEPESTGKRTRWPDLENQRPDRQYIVDQTVGYAANLAVIASRKPDFVAIAGDLVESGGEQRDWDEFWRHNEQLAANTPILPALGNHEYYGGPEMLGGYGDEASQRAIAKYRTYFSLPEANVDDSSLRERFYTARLGPLSLIVLDTNNGSVHRSSSDTNWRLHAQEASAAWNDESVQLDWLRRELELAQQQSVFTFVMFHQAPYSSGVHNQPPGADSGQDYLSGLPLRALTPLFLRYGVDAVFNGHDEVYEHSVVRGIEKTVRGVDQPHELHFMVIGIGGDGLRGSFEGVQNENRVFSAHADAAETYDDAANLIAGGKHYGHLEINIERDAVGCWQSTIEPVHVFPVVDDIGGALRFERRVYKDVTTLSRCASNDEVR